jgi:hypothetical protein
VLSSPEFFSSMEWLSTGGPRLRPSSLCYKPWVEEPGCQRRVSKMVKRLVVSSRDVSTSLRIFFRRWRDSYTEGLRLRSSSQWYKPWVRDPRYVRSRVKNGEEVCRFLSRRLHKSPDFFSMTESRFYRGVQDSALRLGDINIGPKSPCIKARVIRSAARREHR